MIRRTVQGIHQYALLTKYSVVTTHSSRIANRFQSLHEMATPTTNEACKAFKALHVPGHPVVMANVWDGVTANAVAAIPAAKAIATASFAVAAAAGLQDPELTLEANLHAAHIISKVAQTSSQSCRTERRSRLRDQRTCRSTPAWRWS